ncbi:MAG: amidase family protein, partial [Chloroflexi bacterium]|nr:amidase family protein [Chloroflexota bacterium]
MRDGRLTCVDLVQWYLHRIAAYNGVSVEGTIVDGVMTGEVKPIPGIRQLNALIHLNDGALEQARQLDAHFAATGEFVGPLHGVPMAVKDAIDSSEMPSTGGSTMPLTDLKAPADANTIARLRKAGAIILAKANLDEFGRGSSGRSTLGGQTSNAYDTTRIPGGSSGGSAVAVAANLVMGALAEETGVSIRNPASNANIVAIAPTQGLVGRGGVIPISFTQDRVGPYARTVQDAATILSALTGYDPRDPVTAASVGRLPGEPYESFVDPDGLRGARLGVLRQFMTSSTPADQESVEIAERAIEEMRCAGAEIIDVSAAMDKALAQLLPSLDPLYVSSPSPYLDPNALTDIDPLYGKGLLPSVYYHPHADLPFDIGFAVTASVDPESTLLDLERFAGFGIAKTLSDARTNAFEFKFAFNRYLAQRGDSTITSLTDLINTPPAGSSSATGLFFTEEFRKALEKDNARTNLNDPFYVERLLRRKLHQDVVLKVMADFGLDALVYPFKTIPAPIIGGRSAPEVGFRPAGGNVLSSQTGFPRSSSGAASGCNGDIGRPLHRAEVGAARVRL